MTTVTLLLVALTPFQADKVEILSDSGASVVYLIGNVVIEPESARIICPEALLNEAAGTIVFERGLTMTDANGTLTAQRGRYEFAGKRGLLDGSVRLVADNEVIAAETLVYEGTQRLVRMHHQVRIESQQDDMIASGDSGSYDLRSDTGELRGDPRVQIAREGKTPMEIRARHFALDNRNGTFSGRDSVKAVIDSVTVYCDTFDYDLNREHGTTIGTKVVEKNNELSGTHGWFGMRDRAIDHFGVYAGRADYTTEGGSHNVVEGDTIIIFFKENKAYRIDVGGSPHGVVTSRKGQVDAADEESD